ncbi:hypothetical protein B0H66DRAFT_537986 [Apodospora peruviana]|uniref:Uncharacterized protein n=1 Tax=Apodospora peruviana TaxID=516989 RepID=A0AAE0HUQ1_9PEZI|nr:hypothetical protein B0H66DRAFT_537986 [Apodospora peruviana]
MINATVTGRPGTITTLDKRSKSSLSPSAFSSHAHQDHHRGPEPPALSTTSIHIDISSLQHSQPTRSINLDKQDNMTDNLDDIPLLVPDYDAPKHFDYDGAEYYQTISATVPLANLTRSGRPPTRRGHLPPMSTTLRAYPSDHPDSLGYRSPIFFEAAPADFDPAPETHNRSSGMRSGNSTASHSRPTHLDHQRGRPRLPSHDNRRIRIDDLLNPEETPVRCRYLTDCKYADKFPWRTDLDNYHAASDHHHHRVSVPPLYREQPPSQEYSVFRPAHEYLDQHQQRTNNLHWQPGRPPFASNQFNMKRQSYNHAAALDAAAQEAITIYQNAAAAAADAQAAADAAIDAAADAAAADTFEVGFEKSRESVLEELAASGIRISGN